MTVVDALRLPNGAKIETDVCIVGAGAAGLTLAGALASSGREICVLEAGNFKADEDTQSLHDIQCVGYPVRENHMARARYYGGTCNLWAGRAMKLVHSDVEHRPWLGDAGAAWPIAFSEIERFYDRAADILHLPRNSHTACANLTSGDESTVLNTDELVSNVALWAKKPARFGKRFRSLFRDRHATLCVNANATELKLDASGLHVESVTIKTLHGSEHCVRAKAFVLAAGGMENARLLLVSRGVSDRGIGNDHDLVGRCYMDHPRTVLGRVHLDRAVELPMILGTPLVDGKIQIGIGLSESMQRELRTVNSYISLEPEMSTVTEERYKTSIGVAKVLLRRGHAGRRLDWSAMQVGDIKDMVYLLTPKEILPHAVFRALFLMKRRLQGNLSRGRLTIVNYCEQLPDRSSRVTLSSERDRLGVNKLTLDWRIGDDVRDSVVHLHKVLDAQLRRSGIGRVESSAKGIADTVFTDASHHMGTTRMSANPRNGVVDTDCRVHGIENLYIAGSSVFPTSGNANPTWTIVALALRLAEHLSAPSKSNP